MFCCNQQPSRLENRLVGEGRHLKVLDHPRYLGNSDTLLPFRKLPLRNTQVRQVAVNANRPKSDTESLESGTRNAVLPSERTDQNDRA